MAQQIIHGQNHCPCGPHVLPGWGSPTPMYACAYVRVRMCACAYPRVCTRVGVCVGIGACACMGVRMDVVMGLYAASVWG